MITLIIEIILTIKAWRKGWKGWALMPVGGVIAVGFLLGFAVGMSGGSTDDVLVFGLLLDLIAIGVLIAMVVRAPKSIERPDGLSGKYTSPQPNQEPPVVPSQT